MYQYICMSGVFSSKMDDSKTDVELVIRTGYNDMDQTKITIGEHRLFFVVHK